MNEKLYMRPEKRTGLLQQYMTKLHLLNDRKRALNDEILEIDRELESVSNNIRKYS